jgi:hypothetical protein
MTVDLDQYYIGMDGSVEREAAYRRDSLSSARRGKEKRKRCQVPL